jgi:hypothetical protein
LALSARNRAQGTEDTEYTTDKEVWFVTGADSIGLAERKVAEIDAFRVLSASPALDDLQPTGNRR